MGTSDNLFINGNFRRELWSRLEHPAAGLECPVGRQTFAADRWKIRYAQPSGASVSQALSRETPELCPAESSLEIRGAAGVTQNVLLGQRIESAEAARYRRALVFSAWVWVPQAMELKLHLGTAREPDDFGDAFNDGVKTELSLGWESPPVQTWQRIATEFDARQCSSRGLSVELEFPAAALALPAARVRVAGMRLVDATQRGEDSERPAAIERELAGRFFQRYTSASVNSLGRALVVNQHELHFQFTFPQMRVFPAVTLPQANEDLRVFDLEGQPQDGFVYDVTYRARGSVILRATKENHGLRDAYLSFVGTRGAILLDAEL